MTTSFFQKLSQIGGLVASEIERSKGLQRGNLGRATDGAVDASSETGLKNTVWFRFEDQPDANFVYFDPSVHNLFALGYDMPMYVQWFDDHWQLAWSIGNDTSKYFSGGLPSPRINIITDDGITLALDPGMTYQMLGGTGLTSSTDGSTSITLSLDTPVSVTNGGTGASTLTLNNVILGNDTSAVQFVAPGTNRNVLISNATTWQSRALVDADIPDALTISGGTIDNTVIGGSTPAAGTFAPLAVTSYFQLLETTAPATPGANAFRIFAEDSSGRTRLRTIDDTGLTQTLNRDISIICRNQTGSTIARGKVVYISGSNGTRPTIALARANSLTTLPAFGITLESIGNNSQGYVLMSGIIENIDTSALTEGMRIYVSSSSAGDLTTTAPTLPNLKQSLGACVRSNAATGQLEIRPQAIHGEETGTNQNSFRIGDGAAGAKSVIFTNAFTGTLQMTPTAARVLTLPDATDTLVGRATNDNLTNKSGLAITGIAGSDRAVMLQTGGVSRWSIYGSSDAESGGNSGTDLKFARFSNVGAKLDDALVIERVTGNVTIANDLTVSADLISGSLTSGSANVTDLTATTGLFNPDASTQYLLNTVGTVTLEYAAGNANGLTLNLYKARGSTATETAVQSGDTLANINFQSFGDVQQTRVALIAKATATHSATVGSSNLEIYTTPAASETLTLAATFGADQSLRVEGNFTADGATHNFGDNSAATTLNIQPSATGDAALQIGNGRTGDGVSYIDLNASNGTDFDARIRRGAGANAELQIDNNGTGVFRIRAVGAATMSFDTTNTSRMTIAPGGTVDIVGLAVIGGVRVDADPGSGAASTVTLTGSTIATGGAAPATPGTISRWLKIYDGITVRYIPLYT